MSIQTTLIAAALLLASFSAFAEPVKEIKTCTLEGRTRLTEATVLFCNGDMDVKDGAEIITEGHELNIYVTGRAYFGGSSKGFQIRTYDEASLNAGQAGAGNNVLIYALTASGFLKVETQGLKETDVGGDINLEYGSTIDYDHDLFTGFAAGAELIRNGELIALTGPGLKPIN